MRHLLPVFLIFALSGCLVQEAEPFDFATDPHIMRGVYTGTVDTRYFFGDVELSADNKVLATTNSVHYPLVQLWETKTQTKVEPFGSPMLGSSDVALSADGSSVAAIVTDQVQLWDARTGKVNFKRSVYTAEPLGCHCASQLQLSGDGQVLAVGGSETNAVLVFNPVGGELQRTFSSPYASLSTLLLSPDGRTLATLTTPILGSGTETNFAINVWDVQTGKSVYTHTGSTRYDPLFGMSADGRRVAFTDNRLRVLELSTARELASFTLPQQPLGLALSPDGHQLAVIDVTATNIFDVQSQKLSKALAFSVFRWSQDGTLLIADAGFGKQFGAVLLDATNYTVQSRFVSGELHGVRLELTPSYVSETRYELSGTLQVDQSGPVPISGYVEGGDSQRYLAPTGVPSFPLLPPPAELFLSSRTPAWEFRGYQPWQVSEDGESHQALSWEGNVLDTSSPSDPYPYNRFKLGKR